MLSWQVSAPREAVAAGTTVELGLRNEYGVSGECYDFTVEVYDPDGYTRLGQRYRLRRPMDLSDL